MGTDGFLYMDVHKKILSWTPIGRLVVVPCRRALPLNAFERGVKAHDTIWNWALTKWKRVHTKWD